MDLEIKTYSTLWSLVDIDKNEHQLKIIANLFLEAMNDWPTYNQDLISEFLKELKDFYGFPITLEKIDTKHKALDEKDAWKIESGSSIAEMIEFSKLYLNEKEFEKIVENILAYYNSEFKKVDFIAELEYFSPENGGRKTNANSGYRPDIKFDFSEMKTCGIQTFIDKQTVQPGEKIVAKIKIIASDYFQNLLIEGMKFKFMEGPIVIGIGEIKNIVNDRIEKKT